MRDFLLRGNSGARRRSRRESLGRRRSLPFGLLLVLVCVLASLPGGAEACSVCFQGRTDASRVAFIGTTVLMTFLPLVVIGAVAWWVRRQFVKADVGSNEAR